MIIALFTFISDLLITLRIYVASFLVSVAENFGLKKSIEPIVSLNFIFTQA